MVGLGNSCAREDRSPPSSSSSSGSEILTPTTPPSYDDIAAMYGRNLHVFMSEKGTLSNPERHIDELVCSVPEPGRKYMIRDVSTKKAIALHGGSLTLLRDPGPGVGWHWHCEEQRGGWIGFREAVSGKYLGHDNSGGFRVAATKMQGWESFVLRPRDAGGYNLYMLDWSDLRAMGIDDVKRGRPKLTLAKEAKDAARWEFILL